VRGFKDWDKFDVEEACAQVDQEDSGREKRAEPSHGRGADGKVFHRSEFLTLTGQLHRVLMHEWAWSQHLA